MALENRMWVETSNILPHTDFVMKAFEAFDSVNKLSNLVGIFVKNEILLISYLS